MAQTTNRIRIIHGLKLATLGALCVALGCKSLKQSSTLNEAVDNTKLPLHEIPLRNFGYDLSDEYLRQLGQRVNCNMLKQIVAFPKQGLRNSVQALAKSQYVYRDLEANFYDDKTIEKYCKLDKESDNSGATALTQAAQEKGGKVRIIVTSGHRLQSQSKMLGDSIDAWSKTSPGFAVTRVECASPFAPVADCLNEYKSKVNAAGDEQLLFWTHGKGALVVLETLAADKDLRARTIGIVTIGAPFGGSAAQALARSVFRATGKILKKFDIGISAADFERDPFQFLMTPIEQDSNSGQKVRTDNVNLMQASIEMHPNERFKALQQFRDKDFTSEKGDIPVFHIASVLDIAHLDPMPPISYGENGLQVSGKAKNWSNFLQVLTIPSFYDYPLNDGAVALEHAVIPTEYTPKGLKPQMLGLFKLDHTSMSFDKDYQAMDGIPNVAIVDALLATLAAKIQ